MIKGMIFEHVALVVKNADVSIDFYTNVMGFKILRSYEFEAKNGRVTYLHLDEELLEIMEYYKSDVPLGFKHLGFRVENLEVAMEHLKKHGCEQLGGIKIVNPKIETTAEVTSEKLLKALKPEDGKPWKVAMFRDRDGTVMELLER